ncbi:MAG: type II toxin-antitoxin system Phd/YefM family antitoxin [Candidatus Wallbacteria bacterium]|nr:type II toxin-antitoxin system Phd/YefM family antitoxin [Candidatus Wallbacteria bacterium]
MKQVNVHEAKTQLSRLLELVRRGEQVLIAKSGKPVARLVPYEDPSPGARVLGRDRGLFEVPDDFDEPLPDDVLRLFEGRR